MYCFLNDFNLLSGKLVMKVYYNSSLMHHYQPQMVQTKHYNLEDMNMISVLFLYLDFIHFLFSM
jgi:hypothetical protein